MDNSIEELQAIELTRTLIPSDSEERVERVVSRFSKALRKVIRTETGLRLSEGENRASLPIRILPGMPRRLAEVISRKPDPLLWQLLALRSRLCSTEATLGELEVLIPALRNSDLGLQGLSDLVPSISPTRRLVGLLSNLRHLDEIKGDIAEIHEDLLGTYNYPHHKLPWIEIYWMPIALIAQSINVTPEDLTIVVLTHELVHGYTHIGRDIDGETWDRDVFALTSNEVKEGLAQHYTAVVTKKLDLLAPLAHAAYKAFLELQSGPYRVHESWLENQPERRGEAVRVALLAGRRAEPLNHNDWLSILNRMSTQLRNGAKPGITLRLKSAQEQE